jgi:hypothetical protein
VEVTGVLSEVQFQPLGEIARRLRNDRLTG